jgi:hypothetical protein
MSASAYSPFEHVAHVGAPRPPAEFAVRLAAVRPTVREAAVTTLWRELPESTRRILVYLAVNQSGDPDRIAKQPWDSFSRIDQEGLASTARALIVDLSAFSVVA